MTIRSGCINPVSPTYGAVLVEAGHTLRVAKVALLLTDRIHCPDILTMVLAGRCGPRYYRGGENELFILKDICSMLLYVTPVSMLGWGSCWPAFDCLSF